MVIWLCNLTFCSVSWLFVCCTLIFVVYVRQYNFKDSMNINLLLGAKQAPLLKQYPRWFSIKLVDKLVGVFRNWSLATLLIAHFTMYLFFSVGDYFYLTEQIDANINQHWWSVLDRSYFLFRVQSVPYVVISLTTVPKQSDTLIYNIKIGTEGNRKTEIQKMTLSGVCKLC